MTTIETARIRVWDLPTRLFHWGMAACFIGAYLTRESDGGIWHLLFGYTLAGLVLFRIVWGVIGTRYARFGDFIRGPAAVIGYLRGLVSGPVRHYTGHNPAGALSIAAMLLLGIGMGVTGWMMAANGAEDAVKEVHELFANTFLAVVIIHVLGVLVSSWCHRENLPRAMLTGSKLGDAGAGIRRSFAGIALLMLVAIAGFWGWSLKSRQLPFGLSATAEMGEAETRERATSNESMEKREKDDD